MSGDEIRIGVLGPLSVARGGSEVEVRSAKQRLLLAVLVSQAGQPITLDRLVEILWPGSAPASARANVQTYMHRLRGLLGGDAIRSRAGGYQLSEAVICDAAQFERDVAGARGTRDDGDLHGAAAAYRVALQAWRGEAFDGLADAVPLAVEAARLDELRLVARQECYDCELALGHHRSLIPELTRAVADHPLDEHLLAQAMTALDGSGRSADALEMFRRARRRMAEALGVEPGPSLQELHRSILAHSADGGAAGGIAGANPARSDGGSVALAEPEPITPAQLPAAVSPFVGREEEVEALTSAVLATGHAPAVVIITGAGGVGKSTLAIHAAHQVSDRFPDGQLYVDLRGATPGLSPLSPADALTGFVGALGPPGEQPPTTLDELTARFRSLVAGRRVLVVLDDASNAVQLRPILPGSPTCAVLITSRGPLAALEGAQRHWVGELAPQHAKELLAALAGDGRIGDEPAAADDVLAWCDRLPLAISLAGAKLAARPHWTVGTLRDRLAADDRRLDELEVEDRGVRRSFALSTADLSPGATELFVLLGCLPAPDVGIDIAAALIGAPAAATQSLLDELTDAHLVQAVEGERYRVHDLLRLFARELARSRGHEPTVAAAIRRVLHLYLATARANADLFIEPNEWKMRLVPDVLDREPLRFADAEAARAWYAIELPGMIDIATHAAAMPGELPGLVIALATAQRTLLQVVGRWHEARAMAGAMRVAAKTTGDPLHQAQADQDQAVMECYFGRPEAGLDHGRRALAFWRSSGDKLGEAHGLIAVADALALLDRHEEQLAVTVDGLRVRREIGDRPGEAGVLLELGLYHLQRGDLCAARSVTSEAAEIADELDLGRLRSLALGNEGEICRRSGEFDDAIRTFEHALEVDTAIGLDGTVVEAEHWWGLGLALRERSGEHPGGSDARRARECWRRAASVLLAVGLITKAEQEQIHAADDPPMPSALAQMF